MFLRNLIIHGGSPGTTFIILMGTKFDIILRIILRFYILILARIRGEILFPGKDRDASSNEIYISFIVTGIVTIFDI